MNRQNQLLRRISISKRIVILILLVSVLPILLVGSFGYLQARSAIYRTAADYNQKLHQAEYRPEAGGICQSLR